MRDDDLETLNNPEEELTQQTISQSSSVETIPFTVPCNNNNLCKRDDLNGSISLEKVSQSSSKELPWAWVSFNFVLLKKNRPGTEANAGRDNLLS